MCLGETSWEALFVDDNSPDGTADVVRKIAHRDGRAKFLQRVGRRGLSSACIEGMLASESRHLAVMDADLQHDESILPQMLGALQNDDVEIAIGSRYIEGGCVGDWDLWRVIVSRFATVIWNLLVPSGLTDPMSGFFMIRRDTFLEISSRLSGKGFKILADIFASSTRPLAFVDIPYTFRIRHSGESKLGGNETWEFLELLVEKSIGRILPTKFLMFTAVGATGAVTHLLTLGILNQVLEIAFGPSQAVATVTAMTTNFFLNNLITFRDRLITGRQIFYGLFSFYIACGLGAVLSFAVAVFLFNLGVHWSLAGLTGAVAGAVWNFSTTATFTWRRPKSMPASAISGSNGNDEKARGP